MKQHAPQRVPGILSPDQMRQRQRYFLSRSEAILAIQDHAMAAIQHQDCRARALILGLMNVKILVFELKRKLKTFPPQRRKKRLPDIKIHRVAELIALGNSAGLDTR